MRARWSATSSTIKNIRLWDYRPLLRTFAQLQEIRTYYKFVDVDNDRYVVNGEYRQLMLSPRELSYPHLQCADLDQRAPDVHARLRRRGGPGQPHHHRGAAGVPRQGHPAAVSTGGFPKVTRPEIYYGEIANEYVLVRTRSQELDYPRRRPERVHALRRAAAAW